MNESMMHRMRRLTAPTANLYVAVGKVLSDNPYYYDMPRSKFVGLVMKECRGACNPAIVESIFNDLLGEAGLEEIEEDTSKQVFRRITVTIDKDGLKREFYVDGEMFVALAQEHGEAKVIETAKLLCASELTSQLVKMLGG